MNALYHFKVSHNAEKNIETEFLKSQNICFSNVLLKSLNLFYCYFLNEIILFFVANQNMVKHIVITAKHK